MDRLEWVENKSVVGLNGVEQLYGESVPRRWRGNTPLHSNFQPIHLGGSFTETPCKLHNRSLRSPISTAPTPPLAFETGPRGSCERASLLRHNGSTFCRFRFCERTSLPLPTVAFQFYDPVFQTDNERR
ncbi:hypothetical protein AVEN_255398-1 [Araneus ventricosus]|uniref:Uncharacterized protein n=1 Tax=Araneus ventricosus TaxID=182803 RepID=A0A4Y2HTW9_ARAVE|nr:hypothetical protein AVEN_255398-1 [Araneus ventricosus]